MSRPNVNALALEFCFPRLPGLQSRVIPNSNRVDAICVLASGTRIASRRHNRLSESDPSRPKDPLATVAGSQDRAGYRDRSQGYLFAFFFYCRSVAPPVHPPTRRLQASPQHTSPAPVFFTVSPTASRLALAETTGAGGICHISAVPRFRSPVGRGEEPHSTPMEAVALESNYDACRHSLQMISSMTTMIPSVLLSNLWAPSLPDTVARVRLARR